MMFHRSSSLLVLLSSLLLFTFAFPTTAQEVSKIAVVDLDGLFFTVAEGRNLRTQLQDLEKETKAQLEVIENENRRINQEALGKSAIEQRSAVRQMEDNEIKARRIAEQAQRDAAELEQTARKSYDERLEPILRELQEAEGFDLILNKRPGLVVFASTAIDISQALLAKLEPPR